jgi:prepilin-type N-terminal cleavage/methylation domain-containing protein
MMGKMKKQQSGFTIVELLIVIVVIGILAAITMVAYNGVQDRARATKVSADLAMLSKAIQAARVTSGDTPLRYVTNSTATAFECMNKAAGTELATLNKTTDPCWVAYKAALQAISTASNMNVVNIVDPWGRPYVIDENEKENLASCAPGQDYVGTFLRPMTGSWALNDYTAIPYVLSGC